MNIEEITARLEKADNDTYIQNLIAQANARYILYNTQEDRSGFPNYSIKENKLELLAFFYLNHGASLAELNNFELAINPLEKGASILEYIHGAPNHRIETSNYFGLIAALSYYISFQYSKSFILIQKLSNETVIAKLISLFIQKRVSGFSEIVENIITNEIYSDQYLSENLENPELDTDTSVYEITIAKALNGYISYLLTGNQQTLVYAKSLLEYIKEIAEIKSDPGIWWVIRLLILISDGFYESSLWNTLGGFFDTDSPFVKSYIYSQVYQKPNPIYELFITQRKALPQILKSNGDGCIVSIPTSSGKTKIAEIAILDCLSKNDEDKVLYIAPFRSLAFEIESSLEKTFLNSNINVSQLYGGSLFTKLDLTQIEESRILIATPEKAKTILRSNPDIMTSIKLMIIDEGHLFGANERYINNEVFYEELRLFSIKNGSRFLVLSAVLPNADELAEWLTGNPNFVFKSNWRPSDERIGILEWDGLNVNLDWKNNDEGRPTFNNKFITRFQLPPKPRDKKPKFFPSVKNDATAATAYKLKAFGSVLIFVGRKDSVFKIAQSYSQCLEDGIEDFKWKNLDDWKAFELASIEAYDRDNMWLAYAKKGILCHNADLYDSVRLPLERLMRSDKPLVIIATSTLAQGVNIGVSSVIFSTLYQSGNQISARDFWNIAGRAGRAFVDHEGKILVSLDTSDKTFQGKRVTRRNRNIISQYFNKEKIDVAKSGILSLLGALQSLSNEKGILFDHLLELISNNSLSSNDDLNIFDMYFDLIDDGLLSIAYFNSKSDEDLDYKWIEETYKKSLAYIQIERDKRITGDDFIKLLKARTEGIIQLVGNSRNRWKSIIASNLPLKSELFVEDKLSILIAACDDFLVTNKDIEEKLSLLSKIDDILNGIHCLQNNLEKIKAANMDTIRRLWINGIATYFIISIPYANDIICDYYNYKLPWILNGIAKKLKLLELNEQAEVFEELAVLIELGLPTLKHAKIYQAGIRSRSSTVDISKFFREDREWSIKDFKEEIIQNYNYYKTRVSVESAEWMRILVSSKSKKNITVNPVNNFVYGDVHEKFSRLVPKKINGRQYLVNTTYEYTDDVTNGEIDFSEVSNYDGIYFDYNQTTENWQMTIENPFIIINNESLF